MEQEKLVEILERHRDWLANKPGGERANLSWADLSNTNLSWANLSWADLAWANLYRVNLAWANLDFSCLPLFCGGLGAKVDERLARQFCYHALHYALSVDAPGITPELLSWVNEFHRVKSGDVKPLRKGE